MSSLKSRRQNKKPEPFDGLGNAPSLLFPKFSAVARSTLVTGRSSGYRITLLARTFPLGYAKQWHFTGFRPRVQRRDRAGLQPASLLSLNGTYD